MALTHIQVSYILCIQVNYSIHSIHHQLQPSHIARFWRLALSSIVVCAIYDTLEHSNNAVHIPIFASQSPQIIPLLHSVWLCSYRQFYLGESATCGDRWYRPIGVGHAGPGSTATQYGFLQRRQRPRNADESSWQLPVVDGWAGGLFLQLKRHTAEIELKPASSFIRLYACIVCKVICTKIGILATLCL